MTKQDIVDFFNLADEADVIVFYDGLMVSVENFYKRFKDVQLKYDPLVAHDEVKNYGYKKYFDKLKSEGILR